MASFSISYIFKMVDQFTGPASKLGQAAQQMSKGVHQAGAAATTAAGSIDKVGASAAGAAAKIRDAAGAVSNWVREMARAASVKPLAPMLPGQNHRGAAWSIAQRNAAEEAAARKAAAGSGGGGNVFGFGGKVMNLVGAYWLAKQGAHAVDSGLTRLGDVDAMRQKLAMSTQDPAAAARAVEVAKRLSGKYQNTTVLENLHIFDDLRANLPDTFDHILDSAAEPFVKMHGFFKAWEGGKHSKHASAALKDIGAAIRAGELTGNMSAELLQQHTMAIVAGKVNFGEKFKVQEYFQATQKAATALSAADKTFQYVDFPVMIQRLNQGAGVALATMFAKESGIRMPSPSVEMWRTLGLVDENVLAASGAIGKNGKVKPGGLTGTQWIKNSEKWATNLTNGVMTDLAPALEAAANAGKLDKGGKFNKLRNLPGAEIAKAWVEKDIPKLTHLLETFRKGEGNMAALASAMSALGYDRNAAKALEELMIGSASILRDRERAEKLMGADLKALESYDAAKQKLSAQAERLLVQATGSNFMGNVEKAFAAVASVLSKVGDYLDATETKLKPFGKDGQIPFLANAGYNAEAKELADANAQRFNARAAEGRSPFSNFGRLPEVGDWGMRGYLPEMFRLGPVPQPFSPDRSMLSGIENGAGRFASPGFADSIPKSMAVSVEPIRIEAATARVEVNVTGTVNGPVNGSGSGEVQFGSTTTRGTATPDAGAPAGQAQ